ncbi:HSP90 family protein [Glycomyces paridis]|uniref:HSP90 family protein n=1 Tax=Glycomyces paridis TaxID=2126555 RepID=A0A4S8PIC0_9ACTN|nr:HSP90 family protein [Glycomyces paridis]THV28064.1 HSP90 family protein [Glycomyces paridis]
MRHSFQVNLGGMVDLLSHHLYSSPRVYLRELLQNAVDAIAARRADEPDAKGAIAIDVDDDGLLHCRDNGVGLTEAQVHEFLATIGQSSKRDVLGFSRHDLIGQFGIGLLSCFMVADEIEVHTRSAATGEAVTWRGYADGQYTLTPGPDRDEPGTTVTLRPRPGSNHWLDPRTVEELAREFGEFLPHAITFAGKRIDTGGLPWEAEHPGEADRRRALVDYGARILKEDPLDVLELSAPEAGLTGVAFVRAHPANPAEAARHRVYLKRMLIGDAVEGLLPEWGFFVRCVVNATELRPTASREKFFDDDLLAATREALGAQIRQWLMTLAAVDPARLAALLRVHRSGVMALALHDDDALRLVDRHITFETNMGRMTLDEFRRRHQVVRYTSSVDEYRQLAKVTAAQGIGLVNGGYVHAVEIISRLPRMDPDVGVERLDMNDLVTRFEEVDADVAAAARGFLDMARAALEPHGCEPVLRGFEPAGLSVLYLESEDHRVALDLTATAERSEGAWAAMLSMFEQPQEPSRPQLVFNHRNPLVKRMATLDDPSLVVLAVEALYAHSLLVGGHPLSSEATATLNRSFLGLLERSIT